MYGEGRYMLAIGTCSNYLLFIMMNKRNIATSPCGVGRTISTITNVWHGPYNTQLTYLMITDRSDENIIFNSFEQHQHWLQNEKTW